MLYVSILNKRYDVPLNAGSDMFRKVVSNQDRKLVSDKVRRDEANTFRARRSLTKWNESGVPRERVEQKLISVG